MRLLVTRHGETEWNVRNEINGRTDTELTPRGTEQARELAKSLVNEKIDLIISSPLTRSAKTAEIIKEATGARLVLDKRLIEVDFGTYEGAQRGDESFMLAKENLAVRFPEGESMLQVAARIYSLLEVAKNFNEKTLLFVTHGGTCRVINSYFNDMENSEFANFKPKNCCLLEYTL